MAKINPEMQFWMDVLKAQREAGEARLWDLTTKMMEAGTVREELSNATRKLGKAMQTDQREAWTRLLAWEEGIQNKELRKIGGNAGGALEPPSYDSGRNTGVNRYPSGDEDILNTDARMQEIMATVEAEGTDALTDDDRSFLRSRRVDPDDAGSIERYAKTVRRMAAEVEGTREAEDFYDQTTAESNAGVTAAADLDGEDDPDAAEEIVSNLE
jgi:hypothetical protein